MRNRADYNLSFLKEFASDARALKAIRGATAAIDLLDSIDLDPVRKAAAIAAIRAAFPVRKKKSLPFLLDSGRRTCHNRVGWCISKEPVHACLSCSNLDRVRYRCCRPLRSEGSQVVQTSRAIYANLQTEIKGAPFASKMRLKELIEQLGEQLSQRSARYHDCYLDEEKRSAKKRTATATAMSRRRHLRDHLWEVNRPQPPGQDETRLLECAAASGSNNSPYRGGVDRPCGKAGD